MRCTVVADYKTAPSEGINVVSKTLIDDLVAAGCDVTVIPPDRILHRLPELVLRRAPAIVFTHGPGPRTVLASRILRLLSPSRLIWVATRPDLAACPGWLRGRGTAHAIICNRLRVDLAAVATDAQTVVQPIGIAPERLSGTSDAWPDLWPDLRRPGIPLAVHVGHLRRTRGLERLAEVKRHLGPALEVVVQASPHFDPDPGVMEELAAAGVHVRRGFVASIAQVYRSADLYLFPASPEAEGAIDLPLSVIEAMACRTPVISTPFGALPESLAGEAGVTFALPADFTAAVARWVALPPQERARPAGLPPRLDAHRLAEVVLEQIDA